MPKAENLPAPRNVILSHKITSLGARIRRARTLKDWIAMINVYIVCDETDSSMKELEAFLTYEEAASFGEKLQDAAALVGAVRHYTIRNRRGEKLPIASGILHCGCFGDYCYCKC